MLHMSQKTESYEKESRLGHLVHIFLVMDFSNTLLLLERLFCVFSGLQSILVQFSGLITTQTNLFAVASARKL